MRKITKKEASLLSNNFDFAIDGSTTVLPSTLTSAIVFPLGYFLILNSSPPFAL